MTANPALRSLARRALSQSQLSYHTKPLCPSTPNTHINIINAYHLFDKTPQRDLSEYSHLPFEYIRKNCNLEAINLFVGLYRSGLPVNGSILSSVSKACGCLPDQVVGRQLHCQCVKSGFAEDVSVGTSRRYIYMKTEGVVEGRRVFDEMRDRNVVSWTSLISGYARNGLNDQALELFSQMQLKGNKPNPFTFVAVLGVLADDGLVEKGNQVHNIVMKNGYVSIT